MFAERFLPMAAAIAITATAIAGSPGDAVIYAINHQGNFPDFGDTLIRFNANDTEGYETVGQTGLADTALGGLEFDGDGNLWGYATYNSFGGAASGLYSVNMSTGQATLQGSPSTQTLNDLAWNPLDETMYGVYSQGFITGRLYAVDLDTGDVSVAGVFNGLDEQHNLIGIGIDSEGVIYLYDNMNNKVYVSDQDLNLTLLYDDSVTQCDGCNLAVGSQGIGVDWSRDNLAYHGAAGQGVFPEYYGTLNTFQTDGSEYLWGPSFGPPLGDGPQYPPQVQPGDVAIVPADFKAVPGDLDDDGDVDSDDRTLFCSAIGSSDRGPDYIDAADLNSDGQIDHLDQHLFNDILPPCAGDVVSSGSFEPPPDGMTDGADLAFLLGAWANEPSCADFVTSTSFQPPPDGVVDGADLAYLLGAWGACE